MAIDTHGTRETSGGAGGARDAMRKTAVKASRPREESDGVVVPRKVVNATGGKDPDATT